MTTPRDIIQQYIDQNFSLVFWPHIGDAKGPKEPGWPNKTYTLDDYSDGHRVGIKTGTEVAQDKFVHDVDIDWAPGSLIAQSLLPSTSFVFGRQNKRISHCFYTTPEPIPSIRYEDIDKTCLIELRGTKNNGDIGLQTMVPPSIWTKGVQREALTFIKADGTSHLETCTLLKQPVCYAAIGMILAKHLGVNGFGHEPRLAFAGFLLRTGIPVDDVVRIGEAMSGYCNNNEVHDVRRAVESTAAGLTSGNKKIKGGPALAKLIGDKGKLVIARINERIIITQGNKASVLDDAMSDGIWLRIDKELRFRPTYQFFEKVIRNIAHESAFHAVRDYLSHLVWDGVPRLDSWLVIYGGAVDSAYVRAVSSIVLIAAVRRIRHPGCKYDEILVIESGQGMNKSSALRALCPDETWFSDDLPLNVDAKQIIERTLGKWIIEASDLAGKKKAENEHLKSMLSRQVDGPARMAYAHIPVERARQFILIGTTNSLHYLPDSTGGRRFWPVAVSGFDVAAIVRDRDQLWAEASHRERAGESIRLPEALWPAAAVQQEERHARDAWEDTLRMALLGVEPNSDGKRRILTSDLWSALGVEPARRDRYGAMRISEIMQRFGFKPTTIRPAGEMPQRGYAGDESPALHLSETDADETSALVREPGVDDVPF